MLCHGSICLLAWAMDGHIMFSASIISSSCQSAATSKIVKLECMRFAVFSLLSL